jgi:hypothetical protein
MKVADGKVNRQTLQFFVMSQICGKWRQRGWSGISLVSAIGAPADARLATGSVLEITRTVRAV